MRFSIIVPVYNVEEYLEKCLNSILAQTYDDYEVICVEDCSTDNSYQVLSRFNDLSDKITVIKNTRNSGLSASRNRGLSEAQGDYVWFVDSDDYIREDALAILDEYISKADCDAICFGFNEFYGEDDGECTEAESLYVPVVTDSVITGREFYFKNINNNRNRSFWNVAWNACFNRRFLCENGLSFVEGMLIEDWLFRFRQAMCAKKVWGINTPLYFYRRRKGSIMSDYTEKHAQSFYYVLDQILKYWKEGSFSTEEEELLRIYCGFILRAMRRGVAGDNDSHPYLLGDKCDEFLYHALRDEYYSFADFSDDQWNLMKSADRLWIYGAGSVGEETARYLLCHNCDFYGFLVTKIDKNRNKILCKDVYEYSKTLMDKNDVVIIAVTGKYKNEIRKNIGSSNASIIELSFE